MKTKTKLILSAIGILLSTSVTIANIPEPDIIFYGKVSTQVGLTPIPITKGKLTWEIHPKEETGKSYTFSTELESLANGKYSYQLKIPQSLLVNIQTLQENPQQSMDVEASKNLFLRHYKIKVNGETAIIANEKLRFFTVNEKQRANHQELNLFISSKVLGDKPDSDDNGLVDVWEALYGLKGVDADPLVDTDGDGWTNIQEFERGTNPTINNTLPILISDKGEEDEYSISVFENGQTQLRLTVLDTDSDLDQVFIILQKIPDFIEIFHISDMTTALKTGSKITATNLNNGEIIISYIPILNLSLVTPLPLGDLILGLEDPISMKEDILVKTVHLKASHVASISEPLRWIDAKAFRGQSVIKIQGRSGHSQDYIEMYGYDRASIGFKASNKTISIDSDGLIDATEYISTDKLKSQLLAFPKAKSSDTILDFSNNRSIYTVFVANSSQDMTLFNEGNIHLGVDNYYLNYAQTNSNIYAQSTITQKTEPSIWAIHYNSKQTSIQHNGMSAGGLLYYENQETRKSANITGFGFTEGRYGKSDGYSLPFNGKIGEFVVFPFTLEGIKKWEMNAYLLSKWHKYIISDASKALSAIRLSIPNGLMQPSILLGGVADDTLLGSKEDDILIGGKGEDSYFGDKGKDRFILGDGDTVEDFEFNYASSKHEDILDLSELLINNNTDLKHCLFFESANNKTIVKINTKCEGKDFTKGSDFIDSSFIIANQSLQNSDMALLWFSGSLYTQAHKPSNIEASISMNSMQTMVLNENKDVGQNSEYIIDIKYKGEIPFEGSALKLPLILSGDASFYEDFNLTMSRYISPDDIATIEEVTEGVYKDFETLLGVDKEVLASYNLILNPYADISKMLKQKNYDLLKGKKMGDKIYIPAQLHNEKSQSITLKLTLIHDEKKELNENLKITLLPVPEYYNIISGKEMLDLKLSDGLDFVNIIKSTSKLYEGAKEHFTFQRKGSIDTALSVKLLFAGSAINGIDYEAIAQELIFPAKQHQVELDIYALSDGVDEPIELIEVSLLEDERYNIDTTKNQANIYLIDNSLNALDTDNDGLLNSWEEKYGLDPLVSNIDAKKIYSDSDDDGINDYDEFISGTNPSNADSDGDGVNDFQDLAPLDANSTQTIDSLLGYQIIKVINNDNNFTILSSGIESIIQIPLSYSTSTKDDMLDGLKLLVQYNSQQVDFLGFSDVLEHSHTSTGIPEVNDFYRGDYHLYSHQIAIKWTTLLKNWPMMPLPTKLVTARFRLRDSVSTGEEAWIQISSDEPAKGYMLKAIQFKIKVEEIEGISALDLGDTSDSNKIEFLTRALLGMEGSSLLGDSDGSLEQANSITDYVESSSSIYDIDGDGKVNPLVDTVLLYRYLKGTLKEEDILGLLNINSTRRTLVEIENAIQQILAL